MSLQSFDAVLELSKVQFQLDMVTKERNILIQQLQLILNADSLYFESPCDFWFVAPTLASRLRDDYFQRIEGACEVLQ